MTVKNPSDKPTNYRDFYKSSSADLNKPGSKIKVGEAEDYSKLKDVRLSEAQKKHAKSITKNQLSGRQSTEPMEMDDQQSTDNNENELMEMDDPQTTDQFRQQSTDNNENEPMDVVYQQTTRDKEYFEYYNEHRSTKSPSTQDGDYSSLTHNSYSSDADDSTFEVPWKSPSSDNTSKTQIPQDLVKSIADLAKAVKKLTKKQAELKKSLESKKSESKQPGKTKNAGKSAIQDTKKINAHRFLITPPSSKNNKQGHSH